MNIIWINYLFIYFFDTRKLQYFNNVYYLKHPLNCIHNYCLYLVYTLLINNYQLFDLDMNI